MGAKFRLLKLTEDYVREGIERRLLQLPSKPCIIPDNPQSHLT